MVLFIQSSIEGLEFFYAEKETVVQDIMDLLLHTPQELQWRSCIHESMVCGALRDELGACTHPVSLAWGGLALKSSWVAAGDIGG